MPARHPDLQNRNQQQWNDTEYLAVSTTFKRLCTQSPCCKTRNNPSVKVVFPLPDTGDAINNCGFMLVTVDKIGHKDRENS